MTVTVLFFARARELVSTDRVVLDAAGMTVGNLRRRLAADFPALAGLLERCAVAVNGEYAEDSVAVPPGAEVAVIPPVSGG